MKHYKGQFSFSIFLKDAFTFLFCGAIIIIFFYFLNFFLTDSFELKKSIKNVMCGMLLCYLCAAFFMQRLGRYPGSKPQYYLFPTVLMNLGIFILVVNFFRIDYSLFALTTGGIVLLIAVHILFKVVQKQTPGILGIVPFGFYLQLAQNNKEHIEILEDPILNREYRAIIIDTSAKIPYEWQKFIANAITNDIPVISSVSAYESIYGKSPIEHCNNISYEEFKSSRLYVFYKHLWESLLVLSISPLIIPLITIFAIAIKFESKGPAFFTQKRIGYGGKEFTIYKLRSMRTDSEVSGVQFAGEEDSRVTSIGKFIRKKRIDELPQFINILLGQMSLIGPRPEQKSFVENFEKNILLYSYRHIARPGLTGWAQVNHGYADDENSTKEKLAYDFYYIKNRSLWLDINIIFLTIKTIFTGFGAR